MEERTSEDNPLHSSQARNANLSSEEPDSPFTEFQRAVEHRLEGAILDRIKAFREQILKLKSTR